MIEKMKFLSITGPKDDIDRVVDQYLSKYEIQLENALSELKTVANLRPYLEINPDKAELQTAAALMEEIKGNKAVDGHGRDTGTVRREHDQVIQAQDSGLTGLSVENAVNTVHSLDEQLQSLRTQKEALETQVQGIEESMDRVIPFTDLNYDLKDIMHFRYIKFRFGRMTHEYYNKFMHRSGMWMKKSAARWSLTQRNCGRHTGSWRPTPETLMCESLRPAQRIRITPSTFSAAG